MNFISVLWFIGVNERKEYEIMSDEVRNKFFVENQHMMYQLLDNSYTYYLLSLQPEIMNDNLYQEKYASRSESYDPIEKFDSVNVKFSGTKEDIPILSELAMKYADNIHAENMRIYMVQSFDKPYKNYEYMLAYFASVLVAHLVDKTDKEFYCTLKLYEHARDNTSWREKRNIIKFIAKHSYEFNYMIESELKNFYQDLDFLLKK